MTDSQYNIKIDLSSYLINEKLIKDIPGAIVKKYQFMPAFKIGNSLTIAIADPKNLILIDEIQKELGYEIDAVYADPEDIENAINQHYGVMDLIDQMVVEAAADKEYTPTVQQADDVVKIYSNKLAESSVVNLVNLIFNQASLRRASDIHIEPSEDDVLVRLRVDGVMAEMRRFPKMLHSSIVSRIKVMSGLNIAESRIPQDGHIKVFLDDKPIEVRVSTLPTIHGENIVMRLLPKGGLQYGLTQLGLLGTTLDMFKKLLNYPHGIVLVTGPTGSGKTTSLYAALSEINQTTKNIITLEDPVEYQLPLIRQVQVNPKAGLLFSTGLRSILRQDPDIILVGEIRDLETAELAIRSSLTGHMVFSTLHTNDAPSTLIRLVDMGVEPFLVASSVIAVIAQRLVRKICSKCKKSYKPTPEEIAMLDLDPEQKIFKGKGCKSCNQTGYSGRLGIFELLVLDEKMKDYLIKRVSATELRHLALEMGMKSMKQDALEKIYEGITTPEEVLKVVQTLRLL